MVEKEVIPDIVTEFDTLEGSPAQEQYQAVIRRTLEKIIPDYFNKTYFHWIDNLRDWCISRQLWYGHRIPVWYRNNEIYCGIDDFSVVTTVSLAPS